MQAQFHEKHNGILNPEWHKGRFGYWLPRKGSDITDVVVIDNRTGIYRTMTLDRVELKPLISWIPAAEVLNGAWVNSSEKTEQPPPATKSLPSSKGNLICRECGNEFAPSGKRGRPAVRCEECRIKV